LLREGTTLPSAIFTANDLSAVGAIDAIERAGLVVPDAISVVGFDNTALAALDHIGLTTIDQPRREMGAVAAEMVIDAINDRAALRHVSMTPSLVVRRTTAPSAVRPVRSSTRRQPPLLAHRARRTPTSGAAEGPARTAAR
jgi:DNA-binding LacI/PurR family transcriptional regulator